jgi:hypothetical protein
MLVPPVFAGVESAVRDLISTALPGPKIRKKECTSRTGVPGSLKTYSVSSTTQGCRPTRQIRSTGSFLRKLTLDGTSAHEIETSRGHFGHRDRHHRVGALLFLFLHLFPGYDCVACGGWSRVWVSIRTIDFRLREVCLEGANPLVTPSGWERASAMTLLVIVPRQKTYPLRFPAASCSCT